MRLLVLAIALSFVRVTLAAPAVTLCSDQPSGLAARAGVYVPSQLLDRVRKTRRWDLGLKENLPGGITELRIGRDGHVGISWSWHEGAMLGREVGHGCLSFDGPELRLKWGSEPTTGPFVQVADASHVDDEDGPYFDLLFTGCYTASPGGERWCFEPHQVTVGRLRRQAQFKVDLMELPEAGSILQVAGDHLFWLFVPQGEGWAVYRTGWASAPDYREPDWAKPWQVLTRAR